MTLVAAKSAAAGVGSYGLIWGFFMLTPEAFEAMRSVAWVVFALVAIVGLWVAFAALWAFLWPR